MTDLADYLANDPLPQPRRKKRSHPKGWEPKVEQTGDTATAITAPLPVDSDTLTLLQHTNLDPSVWSVVGDIQVRRWQSGNGEWLCYYKFDATRDVSDRSEDLDELIRRFRKRRFKMPERRPGGGTFCVMISDWQAGKGEGGGSQALLDRIHAMISSVNRELRRHRPDHLLVAGLGDLVEGCSGHYDMQAYTVDLNRREQEKLVREALADAIGEWAKKVSKVTVVCVPGNHGENRQGGKAFTDFADNADVAVFEQVKFAFDHNKDAFGHVQFVIPDDEMVVTLEVEDVIIAFAHGHQFRKGGTTPHMKAFKWWEGQGMGRQPAGDADVLVSGHFHHFHHTNESGRDWLQCPSLDGGSKWFTNTTGKSDKAGTLTFMLIDGELDFVRVL